MNELIQSTDNVNYQGDSIFGGSLNKGMNLTQALLIIDKLQEALFKNQDLSCINMADFGIDCADETVGVQCQLFSVLLNSQLALGDRLTALNKFIQNVKDSITISGDEKVKASSTSASSKYLIDVLAGTAGKILYDKVNDQVKIIGLVPIGTRAFINPNRISDFDSDLKGKPGTDVEGWQVRNGKSGTDNALGQFPMYTDDISNAGKKGGNASFIVNQDNMASFDLDITGQIQPALTVPVVIRMGFNWVRKCFGIGGCRDVLIPDAGISGYKSSDPLDLTHTHSHNLSATWTNPTPTAIPLIPAHIKELPIEFRGL